MRRTRGEKVFNVFNIIILCLFTLCIVVPVLYVLKQSLDTGNTTLTDISLIPSQPSLIFYKMIFQKQDIWNSFLITVEVTLIGIVVNMVLQTMGAYTLSIRNLRGHYFMTYLLIVPMLFSGGIVPWFLVIKYIGLMNNFWAMILPGCISGWNMLLIRNYFWSVDESLRESARIDGAGEFTVFTRILVPLAKPVLAAIALFTIVGYWNQFSNALYLISDPKLYPFQLVLREYIMNIQSMENQMMQAGLPQNLLQNVSSESVTAAIIIVSILPMMIIYPFFQRFFVKGIMVGSLKG